jgi:glycosyltransferase involved in cell wall biosynthesis
MEQFQRRLGKDDPRVSIVVPSYRRAAWLSECLLSLIAQEFQDWEAIVVDDGSPSDEIAEVVSAIADVRLRYLRHPANRGTGAALNTGYGAARADLVLPMGSDDKLEPSFLRLTEAVLREDPQVGCVFTDFQLFGDSDKIVHQAVRSLEDMLRGSWIPGGGTLQRRSIWESVGGYCELKGVIDWDFWIGACELGLAAAHIPEPLYLYRRHDGSLSRERWSIEFRMREAIYARHRTTFDHFGLGRQFRASGYLKSSKGYSGDGQRMRGVLLAVRAVQLDPTDARARHHLAKLLIPRPILERVRRPRASKVEAGRNERPHPIDPA